MKPRVAMIAAVLAALSATAARAQDGVRVERLAVQPHLARESAPGPAALRASEVAARIVSLPATTAPEEVEGTNFVGYDEPAPPAAATGLAWHRAASGGYAARIELASPGAQGLRISLRRTDLPPMLEVRCYAPGAPGVLGPYYPALGEGETWWSPIVFAPSIGIEFFVAGEAAPARPTPAISSVSHLYGIQELPCHNPIGTHPEWASEASGVAKIFWPQLRCDGTMGTASCTAYLLNRPASDLAPIAVTAAHCFTDDTRGAGVTFVWFFDSPTEPPTPPQTLGATVLRFHVNDDVTLLALKQRPPGGAAFLPFDTGHWPSDPAITGIHHPRGTFKRISFGTYTGSGQYIQLAPCGGLGPLINNEGVDFTDGITEPGSSGSPLFDSNRRVRGPLSGGDPMCPPPPNHSYYGKFSQDFNSHWAPYLTTMPNPVWLDDSNLGFEDGTSAQPFRTLVKASAVVRAGEQIAIQPGTYEPLTLYRPMTLFAPSGGVTIGP
jgi:hypothetical protein